MKNIIVLSLVCLQTVWFIFPLKPYNDLNNFEKELNKKTTSNKQTCLEQDSLELVRFYHALSGENWNNQEGWLTDEVKNWYGITLSEDGCNVVGIRLYSNRLIGRFPDIQLPQLKSLELRNNRIHTLAHFNLPKLEYLNLNANSFEGEIPDFKYLPNLRELNLSVNKLTGNIPNITAISLGENRLSGNIPNFSHLPNLQQLVLYQNKLTGNIPNFDKLSQLERLNLEENLLTGTIPDFKHLLNLKVIDLTLNGLNGSIPNFSLPNLAFLTLEHNGLSGTIPNFDNLPKLQRLQLSHNNLGGTIPSLNHLEDLNSIGIQYNRFNFTDLEQHTHDTNSIAATYIPQKYIPLHQVEDSNILYVSVEGTLAQNTYSWFKDEVLIKEAIGDSIYSFEEPGVYHCEVRNSIVKNLVLASKRHEFLITNIDTPLSNESNLIQITPNPSTGTFQVNLQKPIQQNIQIQLFNVLGQGVKEFTWNPLQSEQYILQHYEKGLYYLVFELEGGVVTKKVVVY